MIDFKKLMASKTGFLPMTQAQALVALSEGIVREEYFVNEAVNIHPVFEEPWDFNEIERLLAKEDLDMDTIVVLMTIFERLIQDKDKESALFAAESINTLEQRFLGRAQSLKKELSASVKADTVRKLVGEYHRLGTICFARPVLRRFYLAEACRNFEQHRNTGELEEADTVGYIRILLELGLLQEADDEIAVNLGLYPKSPAFRFLAAKSAFIKRDFREVVRQLEAGCADEKDASFVELQYFWTRSACYG